MTGVQPVSWTRALGLMGGLALRRLVNRWQSLRFRRKKPQDSTRTATAPKSAGRGLYGLFLLAIMVLNGFNLASQGLARLAGMADNVQVSADKILVSAYAHQQLLETERSLKAARELPSDEESRRHEGLWTRHLDKILQGEVRREVLSEEEESLTLQRMHQAFATQGAGAFATTPPSQLYAGSHTWPRGALASLTFQKTLAFLILFFVPMIVFLWLGMNNTDLGQVEWSFEWLYSFPVSTRALLSSRLFVYSMFNPPVWLFLCPFLMMVYFTAGRGMSCIPLGLLATLYLSVLGGSVTLLVEVMVRKFLSLTQLKNLQALFTVGGSVLLLLYLASLFSPSLESWLVRYAKSLPAAFAWNPLSLCLLLGSPTPAAEGSFHFLIVGGCMLCIALGVALGSLLWAEYLLRHGLLKSSGPYQGTRRPAVGPSLGKGGLRGVFASELILLKRDRNLLVQVLFTPLLMVGYYCLVNSNLLTSATGNFHHAATMAFAVGSYVLISSAMLVLTRENKTLWLLLTFPRELSTILFEKTMVWACFGLLYAGTLLALLAGFSHHLHLAAWFDAAIALYGVGLYAFIAAGIGILGTNPLETEPRTRMRPEVVYLYMILVTMYAVAIYTPSIWSKFAQLVLSTLLALALWQKVKDHAPYVLDPEQKPIRALTLADGMLAALGFFVLQGVVGLFISHSTLPLALQTGISYLLAGFLVFVLCVINFSVQKVPRLWQSLGLIRDPAHPMPWVRALLLGLICGVGAAVVAKGYLHLLDLVPEWHIWKQDAELGSLLNRANNPLWISILAVGAAPLFEEFIFRGLVFQGLRRHVPLFWAVVGSAALFALVHPPVSVLPVFGLGLATAISFHRTGWLLVPVLAHATYNAVLLWTS